MPTPDATTTAVPTSLTVSTYAGRPEELLQLTLVGFDGHAPASVPVGGAPEIPAARRVFPRRFHYQAMRATETSKVIRMRASLIALESGVSSDTSAYRFHIRLSAVSDSKLCWVVCDTCRRRSSTFNQMSDSRPVRGAGRVQTPLSRRSQPVGVTPSW